MNFNKSRVAAACIGVSAAGFASAGATESWRTLPVEDGTAAAVEWDSGAAIVGRCQDGSFTLLLRPVHQYAPFSPSHYRLDGGEWERVSWASSEGARALFSRTAARMARKISAGGTLELRFTEDGAAPVLYQLEITEDSAPLRDVLSDCGVPLSDPRDELHMIDVAEWESRPQGRHLARHYPSPERGGDGGGNILCTVMTTGSLTDCEITYDSPPGAGFGEATRALAPHFRLHPDQAAEFEGWVVSIPVSWRLG